MVTQKEIQDQLEKLLEEAKEEAAREYPPLNPGELIPDSESELHKLDEDKTAHWITWTIRFSTWKDLWRKLLGKKSSS